MADAKLSLLRAAARPVGSGDNRACDACRNVVWPPNHQIITQAQYYYVLQMVVAVMESNHDCEFIFSSRASTSPHTKNVKTEQSIQQFVPPEEG